MKTCANCGNAGREICKDCIVGNPPSLWQPKSSCRPCGDSWEYCDGNCGECGGADHEY